MNLGELSRTVAICGRNRTLVFLIVAIKYAPNVAVQWVVFGGRFQVRI
jgi:hypothetical protein